MIDWRIILVLVAVFFLTFAICRIVSVCSMACAVTLPLACLVLAVPTPQLVLGILTGILVFFMHRGNLVRLFRGEEKKFKPGSRKKKDEA